MAACLFTGRRWETYEKRKLMPLHVEDGIHLENRKEGNRERGQSKGRTKAEKDHAGKGKYRDGTMIAKDLVRF